MTIPTLLVTPENQLQVAARWLREGALALRGSGPSGEMYRVANDCEAAAGVESTGDAWVADAVRKLHGRV